MNSVANKTRLAEKRYKDKLKKDKKENRVITKKHKEKIKKNRRIKKNYNDYNHQLPKTKKTTKFKKK